MRVNVQTFRASGQHVVKRFVLFEGANFTIPEGAAVVYSEVVVEGENRQEVLELWLAIPEKSVFKSEVKEDTTQEPKINRLLKNEPPEIEYEDEINEDIYTGNDDLDDNDEYYYD